jgi:hypothetical protein
MSAKRKIMGEARRRRKLQSCEMLARRICRHLTEWSRREWTVSVSEDGEVGATVTMG